MCLPPIKTSKNVYETTTTKKWTKLTHVLFFLLLIYRKMGWRLGLQAVTGLVSFSFFMGLLYRPASLYHPQRRAILHLKNQRKKVIYRVFMKQMRCILYFRCICFVSTIVFAQFFYTFYVREFSLHIYALP